MKRRTEGNRAMRERLGIVVAACLYYSGLVKLARWLMQRGKPHLIILNYHRASGGDLRRHLLYLRRHYRMLHLKRRWKNFITIIPENKTSALLSYSHSTTGTMTTT